MVTLRLPSLPFQFTPLREGRPGMFPYFSLSILFQFTPLREGRPPETFEVPYAARQFQFTPLREGRLGEAQTVIEAQAISIHAPPRGATFEQMANAIPYIISIHAPPRGATHCMV